MWEHKKSIRQLCGCCLQFGLHNPILPGALLLWRAKTSAHIHRSSGNPGEKKCINEFARIYQLIDSAGSSGGGTGWGEWVYSRHWPTFARFLHVCGASVPEGIANVIKPKHVCNQFHLIAVKRCFVLFTLSLGSPLFLTNIFSWKKQVLANSLLFVEFRLEKQWQPF